MRLRYGLEFQAQFSNGEAVPSWLCGGKLDLTVRHVPEVGLNALSFRMGVNMPKTRTGRWRNDLSGLMDCL
jgi:hypothetical protein